MKETNINPNGSDAASSRITELFREHQQAIYKSTDRMFAVLMTLQWIAGIVAAYLISPKTWIGSTSQTHIHVWAAMISRRRDQFPPDYPGASRGPVAAQPVTPSPWARC